MKVLWLTHMVLPNLALALKKVPSPRGGWMPSLANELSNQTDVELAIATPLICPSQESLDIKNIRYYIVPCKKRFLQSSELHPLLIEHYKNILDEFQPDIIHVHGTEYFEGQLTARTDVNCPTVISIQGIIDVCRHQYYGEIKLREVIAMRSLRDWIKYDGLTEQKIKWDRKAIQERKIFLQNKAFVGRTLWDKAHTAKYNPNARYYHCDEMLRTEFYQKQWNISNISRYSIFASSADYPLKGFHVLIKAVALLKDEFPDIVVKTPLANFCSKPTGIRGIFSKLKETGYTKYMTKLISSNKLKNNFVALPAISSDEMATEFSRSHAFVLPSLIENSPNSLAEAMLIGTPSVVSYVGGTPSMAIDKESALFFPKGDEAVLAEQLRKIFSNDKLATNISERARKTALLRHNKKKIVNDMLNIYREEIHVSAP